MSAVATPTVELIVTDSATEEIKKFLSSEDDLPETAGLRVRVVPGGCSGFEYSLSIEEESKSGDFVMDKLELAVVRVSVELMQTTVTTQTAGTLLH